MKWYENNDTNNQIVISTRVRLARNINKYPFCNFLNKDSAFKIIDSVKNSIFSQIKDADIFFNFFKMDELNNIEKISMLENHTISLNFLGSDLPKALILQKNEEVSIMINEEDHIRIQSIKTGNNVLEAFDSANRMDNLLEEGLEYAFDKNFGYLTSCLTNIGTGLRISFMLHLPMLERYRQINDITQNISKFGMTIRGIYGEGSKALGGIYQISNQATLGKTEKEIMSDIKNITSQIIEKEKYFRTKYKAENNIELLDEVYRSYGILKNCKKISNEEALNHLSNVWLGLYLNLFEKSLNDNIYNIMMKIQPANLTKKFKDMKKNEFEIYRAKLINELI